MSNRTGDLLEPVVGVLLCLASVVTVGVTGPAGAVLVFGGRRSLSRLRGAWILAWLPVAAVAIAGIAIWGAWIIAIGQNEHQVFTQGNSLTAASEVAAAGMAGAILAFALDVWVNRRGTSSQPAEAREDVLRVQ